MNESIESLVDTISGRIRIPPGKNLNPMEIRGLMFAVIERARRSYQESFGSWKAYAYREVEKEIRKYGGHFEPEDRWKERKDLDL